MSFYLDKTKKKRSLLLLLVFSNISASRALPFFPPFGIMGGMVNLMVSVPEQFMIVALSWHLHLTGIVIFIDIISIYFR